MNREYIPQPADTSHINLPKELDSLVEEMANSEGITEQLKAENQMEWVQRMNNIRNRAEEIVNTELIYV